MPKHPKYDPDNPDPWYHRDWAQRHLQRGLTAMYVAIGCVSLALIALIFVAVRIFLRMHP
jgi:hypothetical protein